MCIRDRLYADSETGGVLVLDHKSCEMIADELYKEISNRHPGRFVEIEVSEDNENGCLIFYPNS